MKRGKWALAVAALQIVAGIVLVASPHIGLATLALLIGIAFILNGIALVGFGIVIRALHLARRRSRVWRRGGSRVVQRAQRAATRGRPDELRPAAPARRLPRCCRRP